MTRTITEKEERTYIELVLKNPFKLCEMAPWQRTPKLVREAIKIHPLSILVIPKEERTKEFLELALSIQPILIKDLPKEQRTKRNIRIAIEKGGNDILSLIADDELEKQDLITKKRREA